MRRSICSFQLIVVDGHGQARVAVLADEAYRDYVLKVYEAFGLYRHAVISTALSRTCDDWRKKMATG
jgi:hypothetical protein